MPTTAEVFKQGTRFLNAQTVFPTITFPTQASGITSCFPSTHGIPLNMWVDRFKGEGKVFDYIENPHQAVRVHGYSLWKLPFEILSSPDRQGIADEHLNGKVKTIYEAAGDNGFSSMVAFHFFARGANVRIPPTIPDMAKYMLARFHRGMFEAFDRSMVNRVIRRLESMNQLPGIAFLYFAPCDGASHKWGQRGQQWYLREVFEPGFSRIYKFFREKKLLSSTLFVLFSDHGHTEIPGEKSKLLSWKWVAEILNKNGEYENLTGTSPSKLDAIISRQGGMTGIYLKNNRQKRWDRLPPTDQIRKTAVVLRDNSGSCLEAVAYRDVELKGYSFLDGKNPMKIDLDQAAKLLNREFYSSRSPDILLFSNYLEGYHFWIAPVNSMHGNINPEERQVPIIFSGNGIPSRDETCPASIVDVAATTADLLGFKMESVDGNILDIIKGRD